MSADGQTLLAQSVIPALFSAGVATALPLLTADAMSPDGRVVLGTIAGAPLPQVARWTAATGAQSIELGPLPANVAGAEAMAMSADGSVIAGVTVDSEARAVDVFRWTEAGGLVTIAAYSAVYDLNRSRLWLSDDGSVMVGTMGIYLSSMGGYPISFRWTEATGTLPLDRTTPEPRQLGLVQGLSADGSLVLGTAFDFGPFLWDEVRQVRRLEEVLQTEGVALDGWLLEGTMALSPDGRVVVGHGYCGGLPAIYRAVIGE